MELKFKIYVALLFLASIVMAQTNTMPEYNLNKNLPGAQYKFSFVHITDTHIGEGISDYGTPGFFNDTMPGVDESTPAKSLRQAVKWINTNHQAKNIKFVVVSGDLTGSGEKSEFMKFKEIMSDLEMPYVPLIGNHDVWPYVRFQEEAAYGCGDSIMNEIFADVYDRASLFFDNWNDGTRKSRTFNPETNTENYLQNFSFEYDDFIFYMMDFNPRYHVNKEEPGIGPEAQLMDWPGGTYRWLKEELASNPRKKNKNVLLVSHHPATDNLLFVASGFVFDFEEYDKLTKMLEPHKQHLSLWMTGHIHINYDYKLITLSRKEIMTVRGMAASKDYDSSYFQVVNVYEVPAATGIREFAAESPVNVFPNPNQGKFTVSVELFNPGATIRLFDLIGNLIYDKPMSAVQANKDYYEFDFSYLSKGAYVLVISDKEDIHTQRFVVQ